MELTYEQAFEEVIADSMEAMLADGKVMEKLAKLKAQDQSLWEKLKEGITWLADKIRELYAGLKPDSKEGWYVAQMKDAIDRIQELFTEGLADAGASYQAANGQKNTESERQYSLRKGAEVDVDKALTNMHYTEDVYLTESSPAIMISQKGVRNLPMLMKASHIRENVFTEQEAKKLGLTVDEHTHYHGLGKPLFLKVIDELEDVTLAYRGTKNAIDPSRRENYFVLVSQHKDEAGNVINVPVYIDKKGQYNRVFMDTNKIATVFGRDDFFDYISREVKKGNLVRIKNRSTQASELKATHASSYSKNASNTDTVSQSQSEVKKFSTRDTEYLELAKDPEAHRERLQQMVGTAVKTANGQKNTALQDGVKQQNREASSRYDYSKPFSQQVEDWINGDIPTRDSLVVSETPAVWKMIGMNALPVTINQTHVDYAINGTKDADHYLTKQGLLQLPEAIKHPVAIISSKSQNGTSLVAMLDIRQNGKQVILPVVIDGFGRQNNLRIDSNAVTSIYGKDYSISKVLYNALLEEANGNLFSVYYVDMEKATALFQGARVLMPKVPAVSANGFVHSIDEAGSPVNKKFSNQTETQQFKRWFGKSKVVNDDGSPLVVYHGTDAEFFIFDMSKGRANMDIQGAFFSPYKLDAQDYGKNIGAFYLSIQNPADESTAYKAFNRFKGQNNAGVKAREYLIQQGYDGVYNGYDEYIAFYPEQIKSATNNLGTFDPNNPNIRYSTRDPELQKANQLLEKENTQLREDVKELKALLKLQRQVTNGTKFTKSSVEAAARYLKSAVNAKGDTKEFAGLLNEFYEYIASGGEITWETVSDMAQPAIQWLQDHQKQERNDYAQEVLKQIRGTKVYLDEQQKQEAAHAYGSYNDFRKSLMGTITLSDSANMSLDSAWHEWSREYPLLRVLLNSLGFDAYQVRCCLLGEDYTIHPPAHNFYISQLPTSHFRHIIHLNQRRPDGCIYALDGNEFKIFKDGVHSIRCIQNIEEVKEILRTYFGMEPEKILLRDAL